VIAVAGSLALLGVGNYTGFLKVLRVVTIEPLWLSLH
jgi:hypothetical protein